MDRPKKRRRKKKILYGRIFFSLILLLAIIYGFLRLPIFQIKSIEVAGNEKVDSQLIVNSSKMRLGDSIIFFKKDNIADNILEIPFLEDVKIKRNLPSDIIFEVAERKPACTIQLKEKYILIDKFGVIIDESESLMLNLSVLKGIGKEDSIALGDKIFNYASEEQNKLLEAIFNGENIFKFKTIRLEEDQAELVLNDDIVVAFGSYYNVDYKLDVLDVMINTIKEDETKKASMILMEDGPIPFLVLE